MSITQSELKKLVKYDPCTGKFIRLVDFAKGRFKVGEEVVSKDDKGYLRMVIHGKRYRLHRLAFLYMKGELPDTNLHIDHINGIKTDNRWNNLRLVTCSENIRNSKLSVSNKSGVVGVCFDKKRGLWRAHGCLNKKSIFLGRFSNKEHAMFAREKFNEQYCHENHGRNEDK